MRLVLVPIYLSIVDGRWLKVAQIVRDKLVAALIEFGTL